MKEKTTYKRLRTFEVHCSGVRAIPLLQLIVDVESILVVVLIVVLAGVTEDHFLHYPNFV